MKDVMGLIYTGENDIRLRELTLVRAVAALPVAGRYRVIDFLMSSMVNSGVRNVGVITQKNYHSLMDHLGSGKEWDLHGKNQGLVILPPFLTRENVGMYTGLLDALKSNTNYLNRSRQEYLILTNSHTIYNADFDDMLRTHVESGADITMMVTRDPKMMTGGDETMYVAMDDDKRVTSVEVDPTTPGCPLAALEVYVIKRETLRNMVDQAAANGKRDFRRDLIQRLVNEGTMKVCGYEYTDPAWRLDSVQSYFNFNMDILDTKVRKSLFDSHPVYTKVRDDMPARFLGEPEVTNSLIANGCIVEGTVENSVLFRGVKIAKGAIVRNCVVMQDAQVQEGAEIDHCILDKQAVIRRNGRLIGPAAYPIVIAKNVVI